MTHSNYAKLTVTILSPGSGEPDGPHGRDLKPIAVPGKGGVDAQALGFNIKALR